MTVGELAAAVRSVIQMLLVGALVEADSRLGEAHQTLQRAVAGSTQPEVLQPLGVLAEARQALATVGRTLDEVRAVLEGYLSRIGAHPAAPAPGHQNAGATTAAAPPREGDRPTPPPQVRRILGELPPKVPKPNPSGRKTHGRIVGDPTGEVILSGDDHESQRVRELLGKAGMNPRGTLMTIHHVEMKVAARMVRTGTRHTVLVINNRACEGFMGCRKLLPVILPAGYTMTVYGPGYHEVFKGGKTWPS